MHQPAPRHPRGRERVRRHRRRGARRGPRRRPGPPGACSTTGDRADRRGPRIGAPVRARRHERAEPGHRGRLRTAGPRRTGSSKTIRRDRRPRAPRGRLISRVGRSPRFIGRAPAAVRAARRRARGGAASVPRGLVGLTEAEDCLQETFMSALPCLSTASRTATTCAPGCTRSRSARRPMSASPGDRRPDARPRGRRADRAAGRRPRRRRPCGGACGACRRSSAADRVSASRSTWPTPRSGTGWASARKPPART